MKNNRISYQHHWVLLLLMSLFYVSCKKDAPKVLDSSALNPKALYVAFSSTIDGTNTGSSNVLNAPDGYIQDTLKRLRMIASSPSDSDIVVHVVLDTTLVSQYNSTSKTNYTAAPPDQMSATDLRLTIRAGQTESEPAPIYIKDLDILTKSGASGVVAPYRVKKIESPQSVNVSTSDKAYVLFRVAGKLTASIAAAGQTNITYIQSPADQARHIGRPITFNTLLNYAVPVERAISIKQDNSLVATYNSNNGTSLPAFPENQVTLNNGNALKIPPGVTTFPVSVIVKESAMPLLAGADKYVLPLRLEEQPSAFINTPGNIIYLVIAREVNNIDVDNTGLTGTVIDRASWSITASSFHDAGFQTFTIRSAIGKGVGNEASGWLSAPTSGSSWCMLDMGSTTTVKGFKMVPQTFFGLRYNIALMTVQSSNDGVSWTEQGTFRGIASAASLSAKEPQQVKFYVPVTARYFRFNISRNYSTYDGGGTGNENYLQNAVGIADLTALQ
ncbi:DUF1735 domain-containing protein [Niabella sp.]|uniref:BT_3987 domain-containing protein n=1 Tax=Niabella sp. TaxID=1962976 RepID=UPI0026233EC0|nr:DUF1735 domain-containing protein [Niabella sp.]